MAKGDDIRDRLVQFSVDVIDLCEHIPKTTAGRHVARQLLRCGTSAAPNYAEARGAESARDFVHKMGIVLKELNEAEVWIDTIDHLQLGVFMPHALTISSRFFTMTTEFPSQYP